MKKILKISKRYILLFKNSIGNKLEHKSRTVYAKRYKKNQEQHTYKIFKMVGAVYLNCDVYLELYTDKYLE